MEVHEEMYGLKEIDFLKVAQKLDPATRKLLESEEQQFNPSSTLEGASPSEGFTTIVGKFTK